VWKYVVSLKTYFLDMLNLAKFYMQVQLSICQMQMLKCYFDKRLLHVVQSSFSNVPCPNVGLQNAASTHSYLPAGKMH